MPGSDDPVSGKAVKGRVPTLCVELLSMQQKLLVTSIEFLIGQVKRHLRGYETPAEKWWPTSDCTNLLLEIEELWPRSV